MRCYTIEGVYEFFLVDASEGLPSSRQRTGTKVASTCAAHARATVACRADHRLRGSGEALDMATKVFADVIERDARDASAAIGSCSRSGHRHCSGSRPQRIDSPGRMLARPILIDEALEAGQT